MNIGERIKDRRKELGLSVDDVADKLHKNRATIYRYESNDIENLPITILEPLAIVLKTTPAYLLNLEDEPAPKLTQLENTLLNSYNKLNPMGQEEAIKRVTELTYIEKYANKNNKNFTTAKEAMEYLLKIPSMAAYGGYNLNTMSDEEIIDFANELLHQFEFTDHKYKK